MVSPRLSTAAHPASCQAATARSSLRGPSRQCRARPQKEPSWRTGCLTRNVEQGEGRVKRQRHSHRAVPYAPGRHLPATCTHLADLPRRRGGGAGTVCGCVGGGGVPAMMPRRQSGSSARSRLPARPPSVGTGSSSSGDGSSTAGGSSLLRFAGALSLLPPPSIFRPPCISLTSPNPPWEQPARQFTLAASGHERGLPVFRHVPSPAIAGKTVGKEVIVA